MPIPKTALGSLRCGASPAQTATITSEFVKDLINAGHLPPEKSYLACDPSKVTRARKATMSEARKEGTCKFKERKVTGIAYDGRKDNNTRVLVEDATGKTKMRMKCEEHISITDEPSGEYLSHFVPEEPTFPEKPALKVSQGLYNVLEQHNSLDSVKFVKADSTNMNTGWKGGSNYHLENLLGRKLDWGICNIHTLELPLRHLIVKIDGKTCSNKGFIGPVCSKLSSIDEMEYNPSFKPMPGGEDFIEIPPEVLSTMSTDQKACYQLASAVKTGSLPPNLQYMKCGARDHS